MGEAGRRIARQQFSWAALAGQMEQVYQECACERRKSARADHAGTPHL
jgi:glycosyltransferase involved in cell wall biosynthesis